MTKSKKVSGSKVATRRTRAGKAKVRTAKVIRQLDRMMLSGTMGVAGEASSRIAGPVVVSDDNGDLIITNSELWDIMATDSSGNVFFKTNSTNYVRFLPGASLLQTLDSLGVLWEQYQIMDVHVYYVPTVAVTSPGALTLGIDYEPSEVPAGVAVERLTPKVFGPIYSTKMSLHPSIDRAQKARWMMTAGGGGTPTPGVSSGFAVAVYGQGPANTTSLGRLYCSYKVRMTSPTNPSNSPQGLGESWHGQYELVTSSNDFQSLANTIEVATNATGGITSGTSPVIVPTVVSTPANIMHFDCHSALLSGGTGPVPGTYAFNVSLFGPAGQSGWCSAMQWNVQSDIPPSGVYEFTPVFINNGNCAQGTLFLTISDYGNPTTTFTINCIPTGNPPNGNVSVAYSLSRLSVL